MSDLVRSKAINNIPRAKFLLKISSVIENCDTCKEKEIKVGRSLETGLCDRCRVTVQAYNRYLESNIPLEYWDLKMNKDFHGYQGLLTKYNEYVGDLKSSYINGSSIFFSGMHGTGKTLTLNSILKKACQKGYTCLYTTLSDIVSILTSSDAEDKFLARKELMMVDFLVVDEVDPRFVSTNNSNDLFARTLESVLRTRASNKLPILMATNSPNVIESFNGALKQSLNSLMNGYIKMFPVLGIDYRINK